MGFDHLRPTNQVEKAPIQLLRLWTCGKVPVINVQFLCVSFLRGLDEERARGGGGYECYSERSESASLYTWILCKGCWFERVSECHR